MQKFIIKQTVMVSEITEYEKVNLYKYIDYPTFDNKMAAIGVKPETEGEITFPAHAEIELEVKITSTKVKKFDAKQGKEVETWANIADYFIRKIVIK